MSCCAAEMADCESNAGCHAVWACMGSTTTLAAAGSVFGELCGDDPACAQECFMFGDTTGGMPVAMLAVCTQACLESPPASGGGSGH
jgi:hypothetical protein